MTRRSVPLVLLAVVALACTSAAPATGPAASGSGGVPSTTATPATDPRSPSPTPTASAGPTAVPTSPAPSASAPPVVASAWQLELEAVEADGVRTIDSALRLFAMAAGPVPGVEVPASPGAVGSISPALRVLRHRLTELPDAQRAAIEGFLRAGDSARTIEIAAASGGEAVPGALWRGGPPAVQLAVEGGYGYTRLEEEVADEGARIRAAVAREWGDIPRLRVRLANFEGAAFHTFFNPTFGGGGFEGCDVFVNIQSAMRDRFETRRSMTYDVMHCFQTWKLGSEVGPGQVPGWAWEGPAEYLFLSLWPPLDGNSWTRYLTTPDIPLFGRTYDAMGFYAQLFWAGIDEWQAMQAVLPQAENPERFAAAGATNGTFLDMWASGLARVRADWGRAWDFSGPAMPTSDMRAPYQPLRVTNGSLEAISQEAYSNHVYDMDSSADLVHVQFVGRPRLSDGTVDTTLLADALFCTTEKGCQPCPDGKPLPRPPTRLADFALLAVSGGIDGTSGTISGESLEDACKKRTTPSPSATPERKGVRVLVERDALPAWSFMAGTVLDVTSCEGPYGTWTGDMYAGGLFAEGQQIVSWGKLPLQFSFPGAEGTQRTTVTAAGTVTYLLPVPRVLPVSYPLEMTVDEDSLTVRGLDAVLPQASQYGAAPGTPVEFEFQDPEPGACP